MRGESPKHRIAGTVVHIRIDVMKLRGVIIWCSSMEL